MKIKKYSRRYCVFGRFSVPCDCWTVWTRHGLSVEPYTSWSTWPLRMPRSRPPSPKMPATTQGVKLQRVQLHECVALFHRLLLQKRCFIGARIFRVHDFADVSRVRKTLGIITSVRTLRLHRASFVASSVTPKKKFDSTGLLLCTFFLFFIFIFCTFCTTTTTTRYIYYNIQRRVGWPNRTRGADRKQNNV